MWTFIKGLNSQKFGKKRRKIRRVIAVLQSHHAWNLEEVPASVRSIIGMTWFCRVCEVQNPQHLEKCRSCKQHWGAVWKPAKRKTRSRSKSQRYVKETPSDAEKKGDEWQVFQEKVPWVQSTPSRSSAYRTDTPMAATGKDLQLPPQPVLPPPPAIAKEVVEESLSTEEQKLLEHLRGLSGMRMELPQVMTQQLRELEQKEQRVLSAKALSHGHLNRLSRLKNQVTGAAKRIKELDVEWNAFMERTMARVKEHAALYQGCRSDLLETYNQKLQELHALKEEVSVASRSLMNQPDLDFSVEEMPSLPTQLAEMQLCLQEGGTVAPTEEWAEPVDLTEAMEEEELLKEPEGKESEARKEMTAMKPFRSVASPTGVAKTHLKPKNDKQAKEKDSRSKEDKVEA